MPRSIKNNYLLKAKILSILIQLAGKDGEVDFESDDIKKLWAIDRDHYVESYLYELSMDKIIDCEFFGDDGFKPTIMCSVNKNTYNHLVKCIEVLSNDKKLIDDRLVSLLSFDPSQLLKSISISENHIKNTKNTINDNELLKPLLSPLNEISDHFTSIRKVAENYDDVYKNILKPVQEESRRGVQATVTWAIISIIFSFIISNYANISNIIKRIIG